MQKGFDEKTKSTAFESLASKFSAVDAGYIPDDAFTKIFAQAAVSTCRFANARTDEESEGRAPRRKSIGYSFQRKPPMINRGYYTRIVCTRSAIERHIAAAKRMKESRGSTTTSVDCQIISLGAGLDPLSIEVLASCSSRASSFKLRFIEVDYADMMMEKAKCLNFLITQQTKSTESFLSSCPSIQKIEDASTSASASASANHIHCFGPQLSLVACDLRDSDALFSALLSAGVDITVPTMILTECVLVYMPKLSVRALCERVASTFTDCSWFSYDMVNPSDVFGKMMMRNLSAQGYRVEGFTDYPSTSAREELFVSSGWTSASCVTMLTTYHTEISAQEKLRITRLEILDELEEFDLLMNHYCITIAVKGDALTKALREDASSSSTA